MAHTRKHYFEGMGGASRKSALSAALNRQIADLFGKGKIKAPKSVAEGEFEGLSKRQPDMSSKLREDFGLKSKKRALKRAMPKPSASGQRQKYMY